MITSLVGVATIVIGVWQFEGWLRWIFVIVGIGFLYCVWPKRGDN